VQNTPLNALHLELGAKMAEFAGYSMPISYPAGVMQEHLHTREKAGLFDVSHMGQAILVGEPQRLEQLVPASIESLKQGRMRYTQLTNETGGIIDDLMVTKLSDDRLFLVVNGARKAVDFAHISASISGLEVLADRALLALQGPLGAGIIADFFPATSDMPFMSMLAVPATKYGDLYISRCGYTGEDGFEISVNADGVESLARDLLANEAVEMVGLAARDSLRLEAGLCLYGHDIDEATSPVEAGLGWSISKSRRQNGGFNGEARILRELAEGAGRKLVGIKPEGRAPAREGVEIFNTQQEKIGTITSGGYGSSVGAPVSMGYVATEYAQFGTRLKLLVRGKYQDASVSKLPFTPHRYFK